MRLHHYAEHDSLTGLLNRSMLQSEVEKALDPTQSSSVCGAFLLVDVDHFKNINDSYGHDFGDHMLQHIADLLRTTFALDNLVARFGGDEFAVWIQNIDKGQASFILTRINEINQQLKYPEKFYPEESYPENSISVGVAFAQSGDSFTSLYKKADEVLYQVKDNGRCGVKIYSET
jgi:diguanylate cyclase (GGDEF)-like protein